MKVAAVDIGTNSVRLLIATREEAILRRTTVTGLGRGVADSGNLHAEGRTQTLEILARYGEEIRAQNCEAARAVMTAVGRNTSDAPAFLAEAESVLGFPPEIISGEEEAELSYQGAVSELGSGLWTVVDIGGGSTEIVTDDGGVSNEIGSVKLTDRHLARRPVEPERIEQARATTHGYLATDGPVVSMIVGVAGTWTSLAGLTLGHDDPTEVHGYRLTLPDVTGWVDRLAELSVEETADLPGFDPARAPVILGGSIVAEQVMEKLDAETCLVSERDLLDGIVARLRR